MLDGDLVLGPVSDTFYSLFQKEISNIPTVTPSLFTQTRRITRHNISVTRYKSVIKTGHNWSPTSNASDVVPTFMCWNPNYIRASLPNNYLHFTFVGNYYHVDNNETTGIQLYYFAIDGCLFVVIGRVYNYSILLFLLNNYLNNYFICLFIFS